MATSSAQYLAVLQQHAPVVRPDHRKLVKPVDDPAPRFAREVTVLDLADIDCRVLKKLLAVMFQRADVIRILMRDEDMRDRGGVDIQPAHLFTEPSVVVARVDHDGHAVLRVEKYVRHPFAHAGDAPVDAPGVQRLEYRLPAEQTAHGLLLIIGILPCHYYLPNSPRFLYGSEDAETNV